MYVLLSILVAKLAVPGRDGRAADGEGALRTVAAQPAGRVLLAALAVGFVAYALWQWRCTITGEDAEAKLAAVVRGVLWTGMAVLAIRVVIHDGGSSSEQSVTARLLAAPFGPWLVAAIGVAVVVGAVVMLKRLRGQEYLSDLQPLDPGTRRVVAITATIGLIARTLVYALAGGFLIRAAVAHDPQQGVGLDGALSQVASQPYGRYVLAGAAAGLAAYAAWCVVRARYENVDRSDG